MEYTFNTSSLQIITVNLYNCVQRCSIQHAYNINSCKRLRGFPRKQGLLAFLFHSCGHEGAGDKVACAQVTSLVRVELKSCTKATSHIVSL